MCPVVARATDITRQRGEQQERLTRIQPNWNQQGNSLSLTTPTLAPPEFAIRNNLSQWKVISRLPTNFAITMTQNNNTGIINHK